jgi:hypothetical protein
VRERAIGAIRGVAAAEQNPHYSGCIAVARRTAGRRRNMTTGVRPEDRFCTRADLLEGRGHVNVISPNALRLPKQPYGWPTE